LLENIQDQLKDKQMLIDQMKWQLQNTDEEIIHI
jgi:hypothetical protein